MALVSSVKKFEEVILEIQEDKKNILRVIEFLKKKNGDVKMIFHSKSKNSEKAALEIGVELKQIVKSIVFVDEKGKGYLILARGDSRVDEEKLEKIIGKKLKIASPEEVKRLTGYKVGGVSPFDNEIPVFVDEKILENEEVQPSGGSTCVGVLLSVKELLRLTGGKVIDVC